MPEESGILGSVRFGRFELSADSGELRRDGIRLKLSGQAIQVLAMLVANPGKLVTREDLQQKLWPGASYGDPEHGLNAAVNKLRETLGDSATDPTYIETVPGRGYRFVGQIESDESPPAAVGPEPPKPRWNWRAPLAVAAVVLVIVALLYPWLKPRIERQIRIAQLQRLKVVPLTSLPGTVYVSTFSPDGSQVAFVWSDRDSNCDLYVKVIGQEKLLRLTHRQPPGFMGIAWSPDGGSIAISQITPNDSGVYLVSPVGGAERKIADRSQVGWDYGNELSWSSDGKQLALIDHSATSPLASSVELFLLSLNTLKKTLVKTDCNLVTSPAFSPKADYLAWVCVDSRSSFSLHVQRLVDGLNTELLRRADGIGGIAWSRDGRHIAFTSPLKFGDLLEVSVKQPYVVEKLPVGHDAMDVAVSPTGNRLAFTQNRTNTNIWRLDLSEPQPHARIAVTSSQEQTSPTLSPDGKQVAFQSSRTGNYEIWVSDIDGSNALQLSSFGIFSTGTPRWSPDGMLIAFDSWAGGESNVYLVDPHGGVPRELDIDIRGNNQPSWSRDGKWIYFVNGEDAHHPTAWKAPSTGGHAVPVTKGEASLPLESPDGKFVYYIRQGRLWSVRTDGTAEQQVEGTPEQSDGWMPYGTGMYFIGVEDQKAAIKFFDLETKKSRLIYVMEKFPPPWIGGLAVSSDGKWLLFPQKDEQSSDLMMIENWN